MSSVTGVRKITIGRSKIRLPDALTVKAKVNSVIGSLFTYALMIIIAFIILFPFFSKISASFMSVGDMYDRTVNFIPKHPNIEIYQTVISAIKYPSTAITTMILSLLCAFPQMLICAGTGYALAKLKNNFSRLCMGIVILTILVPPQILLVPLYLKFRYFDVFGIMEALTGRNINLIGDTNGFGPFILLSLTGMAFKNGIYIFLMRQFYKGVPEELEEAAYIDGCSIFKTYFVIIAPLSIPMFVTIFIFSFAWQWTDTFYSGLFMRSDSVLANVVFTINTQTQGTGDFYKTAVIQTAVILSLIPIIIVYIFAQKKIIAGIERSGIVG